MTKPSPPTNRWLRLLKHRWHDEGHVHRALSRKALDRIEARVAASEKRQSGEIRVCVEGGLPLSYLHRHATAHERAVSLFAKLRVWDTEHNNGVLIYLLLADRAIEIVADRGLDRHVQPEQWHTLLNSMSAAFKDGRFEDGLIQAVDAVTELLCRYFPLAEGERRENELPNRPLVQ
jgi:uncharacterized membrane protein